MRINAIRKNEADVTLDATELVWLMNVIHSYQLRCDGDPGAIKPEAAFHGLAKHIAIAKNLCQYGTLDGHALKNIVSHDLNAHPDGELAGAMERLCDAVRGTKINSD